MLYLEDLLKLCSKYEDSKEEFSTIVALALKCHISKETMSDEFEVAGSTVTRWSVGTAKPHPRMRKEIVSSIKDKAENLLQAK